MKSKLKWYIKERDNPQTGTYFVPQGLLTKRAAKAMEATLYGHNILHSYDTKEEYEAAIKTFQKNGGRVYKEYIK